MKNCYNGVKVIYFFESIGSHHIFDISTTYTPSIFMKKLLFSMNKWLYDRLKEYADENGLTVVGAIRMMINHFLKNRP